MPTKKTPAQSSGGNIIDVTKPGRSPASGNSKHVIVSNPVVQDPMVTQAGEAAPDEAMLTRAHKLVIKPIHDNVVAEETPVTPVAEAPTVETLLQKAAAPTESKPTPEPAPEPAVASEPVTKASEPVATAKLAVSKPTETVAPAHTTDAQVSPEAAQAAQAANAAAVEQAAHIQSLVEKGTYFLPINAVERRRNQRVMMLGVLVIVVLAVAWLDVALDAGLIPNSANLPHSHFFIAK